MNLRDDADESVYNEIFKFREYRVADEVIKNAEYPIVDVGAHAGFFSMYCRALNEKVKILAIEPEPNNSKALKNHLEINKVSGVKVIEAALAGESGSRELEIAEDSHNHTVIPTEMDRVPPKASAVAQGSLNPRSIRDSSSRILGIQNDRQTMVVKALSFSDFCKQYKIKKIALMKLDIEGGEYEVFEGMSDKDLSVVNYVILEYHMGREKSREIEEKLRINGFAVQVFPSKFDKAMGFIFAHNKRF